MFALIFATFLATEAPAVNGEMQALYDGALASFQQKKWEESIAPLKTLTAAGFKAQETGFALRSAYEQAYGLDGAIAKLEQEVREKPEDAVAHNALGVFYLAKGRREESRHAITRALQIAPDNVDARMSLAYWYSFVGQSRAAITEYESIVVQHPAILDPQIQLCELISVRENDPKRAIPYCEKALALAPAKEDLAVSLGLVQMRAGDAAGAEKTFREAALAHPEGTLARKHLGIFQLQKGQVAEARGTFESLLAKNADDVDSRIWLARSWQAEKDHASAVREYKIAYEKQGGGMLLGALAKAYLQQYFYAVIFVLLAAMGLLLWRYLDVKTPDAPAPAV